MPLRRLDCTWSKMSDTARQTMPLEYSRHANTHINHQTGASDIDSALQREKA
jgi:hypothetical protein